MSTLKIHKLETAPHGSKSSLEESTKSYAEVGSAKRTQRPSARFLGIASMAAL